MIGQLSNDVLEALLEAIPVEFSVLDANDQVLTWNKHDTRTFKRPIDVVGSNVRDCHPKTSIHKVELILSEMKSGKRDKARFWIDLTIANEEQKILIEYYALRDEHGNYLGCLETSQNITDIQTLTDEA